MANQDITDFDGADIIDVRDVIARVEELREERDDLINTVSEACNEREAMSDTGSDEDKARAEKEHKDAMQAESEWRDENAEELSKLEELLSDLCGYGGDEQWEGDWYPVTLIKESYFETYMDDMLEDIGDLPKNLPSYLTITVDYDALKQDYSEVEFEGNTYYYR